MVTVMNIRVVSWEHKSIEFLNFHLEFLSISYLSQDLPKPTSQNNNPSVHKLLCLSNSSRVLWLVWLGSPIWLQSSGRAREEGRPHSRILKLVLPVGWEWPLSLLEASPGFLIWWSQGSKSLRAKAERPFQAKILISYDALSAAFPW